MRHYVRGFDEVVEEDDLDFEESGLRVPSVIRIGRLAVVFGVFSEESSYGNAKCDSLSHD